MGDTDKESKKRKREEKKKYIQKKAKPSVDPSDGLHGVFVTCDRDKEGKCTQEMLDLLQEIAETYYPVKEEDHKDATLEDELSELKGQEGRRFFSVKTNCKNIVFIRFVEDHLDPIEFTNKIFEHIVSTKQQRTRFSNKILPIQKTGPVSEESIVSLAKPYIKKAFHGEQNKVYKFKVDLQHRYNDSFSRDNVKKGLVMKVGRPHKVDLKVPDKTIIVQVFNKTCGVSVVDAAVMAKYRGYNIRMVTDEVTGFQKEKKPTAQNNKPNPQKRKENEEIDKIFTAGTEIEFKQVENTQNEDEESSESEGISLF